MVIANSAAFNPNLMQLQSSFVFVFFNDTATTEIYTLSQHDALPILMEPLSIYKSEITVFLHEHRFLSEKAFSEIKVKRDEFENIVVDVIKRGMDSGVFKKVATPRLVAFGVIGMCAWSYTWLETKGKMSPREIGESYGNILVDGLAV